MTTPPDTRAHVPMSGEERDLLLAFLDFHRQTLQWKCAGLSAAQLARASMPPSDMSLLGMVRHITEVEAVWFEDFDGSGPTRPYSTPEDRDAGWHVHPDEVTDEDCAASWSAWHRAVEVSRSVVEANSLDAMSAPFGRTDKRYSLRWAVIHMIEEYARHNGHADLLRQAIDGAVGE